MSYRDIATYLNLHIGTLRKYRTLGVLPPADYLAAADRPRWRYATIKEWAETRPGVGQPGVPRRRGKAAQKRIVRP